MSGYFKPRCLQILTALSFLCCSVDAQAMTISPSPSSTGNYTVSWGPTGCQETGAQYPYPPYICYYLYEDSGYLGQSSPVYVSGKPAGTYNYYVLADYLWYQETVDSGSVIVGTPPPRDPISTQLNYQYQTRAGDANADGRTDIFVKRTSGGVAGNGVLDELILWQNTSGGFYPIVPDAYYSSLASGWPLSSATTVVDDLNVDGYVDVAVKGVAAATGGAVPYNQIVFSSGVPLQPQPLGLRPVDASLKQFVANSLDYNVNPNYFYWNAYYGEVYGYYYYYSCSFSPYYYGTIESYYYGNWGCAIYSDYFYGYYVDYSGFSEQAVAIWLWEEAFAGNSANATDSTTGAQQAAEDVIDVQIGGWPMEEELGSTGEHTNPDVRRGLETFWAILGIGRAYAQEIDTDEAPSQAARQYGTIYVTSRPTGGILPAHTALEFDDEVISATDSEPSWFISGYLDGQLNHGLDRPRFMMTEGSVSKIGTPAGAVWLQMLNALFNYDDDLLYAEAPAEVAPFF